MTLGEMAVLLEVETKWVMNALTALRRPQRYSVPLARRLAVARAIQDATGSSLTRSFADAGRVVRSAGEDDHPVMLAEQDSDVVILVDLRRILSSFSVRLSLLQTTFEPAQRGRPPAVRRDALQTAEGWGLDLTLLADNLSKTVEQRVRQLDAMAAFARRVRRVPA